MSAERLKHPYKFYGLKIITVIRDFGAQLADEGRVVLGMQ